MLDQRKSVRMECELPSSFQDLGSGQPDRVESATVRNISRDGIKICVNDPVAVQSSLYVSIPLPEYHHTIRARVIPLWTAKLPDEKYEVGGQFVDYGGSDCLDHFLFQNR